jgi:hypothetical protein
MGCFLNSSATEDRRSWNLAGNYTRCRQTSEHPISDGFDAVIVREEATEKERQDRKSALELKKC